MDMDVIDLTETDTECDTKSVDSVDIFAPYSPPHKTTTKSQMPPLEAPCVPFPDLDALDALDALEAKYNMSKIDFSHLREHGYQVIDMPVLTHKECEDRISEFWDWLESLGRGIKRNDPKTWMRQAWPANIHGIVQYPSAAHARPTWKIRSHHNVVNVFSQLWQTPPEQMQTSFDRVCIQRPTTRTMPQKPWLHMDQGARLRGERCVQGFVTLKDMPATGGTLVVMPGSHRLHEEFFDAFPDRVSIDVTDEETGETKKKTFSDNWVKFTQDELDWWKESGCEPVRISAKAGQLVLWDSRTVHQGSYPLPGSAPQWRWVVYVCMKPTPTARDPASRKKLARAMQKKQEIFLEGATASHWPVPEKWQRRHKSGKVTEEWMGLKKFPAKPQYSRDQKPEPRDADKIRTVEELRAISPLAPVLAGFSK